MNSEYQEKIFYEEMRDNVKHYYSVVCELGYLTTVVERMYSFSYKENILDLTIDKVFDPKYHLFTHEKANEFVNYCNNFNCSYTHRYKKINISLKIVEMIIIPNI